ncbi:NAD-dependent protein deacetylase sirtuin-1 [Ixodes scapularis]
MADRRESLCASPAYKRPRLENDSNLLGLSIPNDVVMPPEEFKRQKFASDAANVSEVTSSSDANSEMCNGDSGFHELTSTSGADLPNGDGLFPENDNVVTEGVAQESPAFLGALGCEEDDGASTLSELSGLSDLSEPSSGSEWKPSSEGPMGWVQRQMSLGADPRALLERLLPEGALVPPSLDRLTLWRILVSVLSEDEPPRRAKLPHVNTLDDVVHLLRSCRRILVLTGAGVSVSCGIPDFRSRDGIYARLSKDFPALPDPQAMFDIHYFRKDPRPFFKFAKEIYPGQFLPSPSHCFIKRLEESGKLLRNYTQNIDTLEQMCGIRNVITCHGSFATASCTRCRHKVDCHTIKDDIFNQRIPLCPECPPGEDAMAVMKPDIVFFGEGLSPEFHQAMARDKAECDLLIVMGSSLKVRPVALIPSSIPADVPQILINREPLKHVTFDVELLGDCDVIIHELCHRLGWEVTPDGQPALTQLDSLPSSRDSLGAGGDAVAPCSSSPDAAVPDSTSGEVVECSVGPDRPSQGPWKPRESVAARLPGGHFLFTPPSTYVFSGAEVFVESEDSDSPSPAEEESDSSFSSDEEEEAAGTGSAMECEAADRPPVGQQGSPGKQGEAETARGS